MQQYRHLHFWMIIPMVIMQTGFIDSYWLTWRTEQWVRHMHALSAMMWYLLLILQPYLATHGKLTLHRTVGMIGLVVAGATVFTAISLLPQDVEFGDMGGFGEPFNAAFFYGVVMVELVMMTGFLIAVVMSVVHRKKVHEHAIWLISTVFYIMMPGLGRGMYLPVEKWYGPYNQFALNLSSVIIIAALLFVGWRLKRLQHPAIWLGIAVNLPTFLTYWLGNQPWYVEWIRGLMVYRLG